MGGLCDAADRILDVGPLDQPYPIRFPVAHHEIAGDSPQGI